MKNIDITGLEKLISTTDLAYKTSMTEIATREDASGSGSGGGFSSGGGERWPAEAKWVADKI